HSSERHMTTNPHRYALITFIQLVDLAVIALGFALAVIAELRQPSLSVLELRITVGNVIFLVGFLGSCHLVMRTVGLYRSRRRTSLPREGRDLRGAVLAATTPLSATGRLRQFESATRSFPPTFALITFIALALERRGFRFLARAVRRHGHNIRNVIVVGRDDNGFDLASRLVRRGDRGYAVEAVIEVKSRDGGEALEKVTALLESRPIDEVFITLPLDAHQALIRDVVSICEEQGVTIRVLSGLVDLIVARAQLDEIDGRPVVTIF